MPDIAASEVSPPVMIKVAHVMSGLDELVQGVAGREVERSFTVVKVRCVATVVWAWTQTDRCRSGSAWRPCQTWTDARGVSMTGQILWK